MKIIYWICLTLEGGGTLWYLNSIRLLGKKDPAYVYPEDYRKLIFPALVLGVLFLGGVIAKFVFHAPKVATYIVLTPVFVFILALLGMVFASMMSGGNWR